MSKISDLVTFSKSNPDPTILKDTNFGYVPNFISQQVLASTGINIKGALRVINSYSIIHAIKRHGNDAAEKLRGQSGITDNDFELIPTILNDPDNIKKGTDGKKGKQALIFTKLINGKTYYTIMSVFNDKGQLLLEFDTMYKKK